MPKKQKSTYPGLAAYESNELPPITEFALLAAILGPRESYPGQVENLAFKNAVKFYQRAADFHRAYRKATPEERAELCGDFRLVTEANLWAYARDIPQPTKFPASYDEFLRLVVKAKTPADSEKRLRDFFRSECRDGQDADKYAAEELGKLKQEGFASPCKPDIRIEQRGSKHCAIQSLGIETATGKKKETVLCEAATEKEAREIVEWQITNSNIIAQTDGWMKLASRFLQWHEEQVANTNKLNKLGKTKQPPLAEA